MSSWRENVVDALEPQIADFILATSITERTCGGLASVLSEHPRGLAMLEEVAHRGLFLQRIDDEPDWFRYHQLFAEFLRHRLARDDPERSQRLHRRAAAWLAEHGYLNEAVNHALAADDARLGSRASRAATIHVCSRRSKMTTLLEIAKKLPPPAGGIQGTTSARDRLGEHPAAAQGARRCRAESPRGGVGQRRTHG